MRNFILTLLILVLTCGCSTPKMTNSIWCTVDPVQNHDQEGLRITSLYMYVDGNVDVYQSIVADSSMVVAPFLFAKGTFSVDGNLKKEATISFVGTNKNGNKFHWGGIIDLKKKSMLLTDADSTTSLFYKYGNLTIQQ